METTKTSHFTCQSKSFISIFFTCQISACELQPFSRHNLANDIYLITDKTVFSHLNNWYVTTTTTTLPMANCLERQISWISYIGYWHDLRNCMKNINTEMRNNYEIEHLHICFILSNSSSAWTCYVRLRTRHNSLHPLRHSAVFWHLLSNFLFPFCQYLCLMWFSGALTFVGYCWLRHSPRWQRLAKTWPCIT